MILGYPPEHESPGRRCLLNRLSLFKETLVGCLYILAFRTLESPSEKDILMVPNYMQGPQPSQVADERQSNSWTSDAEVTAAVLGIPPSSLQPRYCTTDLCVGLS